MEKMSTTKAWLWFAAGFGWFLLWTAMAMWSPWSSKVTPSETPQKFFSKAQHEILYPPAGKPKFDAQNPNPHFALTDPQVKLLKKWDLNDCIQNDGTAAQKLSDSACFCENAPAVRAIFDGGFAVQPANTLSTFTLSIVGLIILGFLVFSDPPPQRNLMTVTYFFALCYAGMTIILGPFSMMLHVGLRNWGGWCDSLSLYIWFGFVMCYGFFRFILACMRLTPTSCPDWSRYLFLVAWLGFIALAGFSTMPGVNGPIGSEIWYVILGGLALVGEFLLWLGNKVGFATAPATSGAPSGADHWYSKLGWSNLMDGDWGTGGRTWFAAGGVTFLVALVIWVLSWTRMPLCAPDSWFQGHAIFHSLSAVAAACLYKYYRHEGETRGTISDDFPSSWGGTATG